VARRGRVAGAFVVGRPAPPAGHLVLYLLVVGVAVAYGLDIPNGRCDV